MNQFRQFTNGNGLFIGVDFGFGNDFAVETQIQKQPDGSLKILSSNIIVRAEEYKKEEKREQKCKEYDKLFELYPKDRRKIDQRYNNSGVTVGKTAEEAIEIAIGADEVVHLKLLKEQLKND